MGRSEDPCVLEIKSSTIGCLYASSFSWLRSVINCASHAMRSANTGRQEGLGGELSRTKGWGTSGKRPRALGSNRPSQSEETPIWAAAPGSRPIKKPDLVFWSQAPPIVMRRPAQLSDSRALRSVGSDNWRSPPLAMRTSIAIAALWKSIAKSMAFTRIKPSGSTLTELLDKSLPTSASKE